MLVGGEDIHLENLRSAWGRRVLKAPNNFTIDRIGECVFFGTTELVCARARRARVSQLCVVSFEISPLDSQPPFLHLRQSGKNEVVILQASTRFRLTRKTVLDSC